MQRFIETRSSNGQTSSNIAREEGEISSDEGTAKNFPHIEKPKHHDEQQQSYRSHSDRRNEFSRPRYGSKFGSRKRFHNEIEIDNNSHNNLRHTSTTPLPPPPTPPLILSSSDEVPKLDDKMKSTEPESWRAIPSDAAKLRDNFDEVNMEISLSGSLLLSTVFWPYALIFK